MFPHDTFDQFRFQQACDTSKSVTQAINLLIQFILELLCVSLPSKSADVTHVDCDY